MRNFVATVFLFVLSNNVYGQILKGLEVYYHDDQSVKGKNIYREFKYVGDSPFWSKPDKLDIVLTFNNIIKPVDNEIEVMIDELYEPTSLPGNSFKSISDKRWVPHKVVYSANTNFIKYGKILIKNCDYQTAYYLDNILYTKDGFRIVVVYHDKSTNKVERLVKTYLMDSD